MLKSNPSHNIVDILYERNCLSPRKTVFSLLTFPGEVIQREDISYEEIYMASSRIAHSLSSCSNIGDRVLLCFSLNDQKGFLIAFFGCLAAGRIAVPIYPPKLNKPLERFKNILNDSEATVIVSNNKIISMIKDHIEEKLNYSGAWIEVDNLKTTPIFNPIKLDLNSIAFLQYTSGSTGSPKGVMVTHNNIINNQKMIETAFGHNSKSDFLGWLPLFHDMGLIGNVMQPLYIGSESLLMSPACFMENPLRWLQAISKYKIHTSGGPNFSYDLCIKAYEKNPIDLDLSNWKVAFNGAEPVHAKTLERFFETFNKCGFDKKAIYPCYGLAEATLFVTGSSPDVNYKYIEVDCDSLKTKKIKLSSNNKKLLISSGKTNLFNNVTIVHSETKLRCQELEIGEIWLTGEAIANGYWKNKDLSKENFLASILNENESKYYLRTGDLGFVYQNELYVTGRIKDLIIIRGKNYYPQDLESIAREAHPMIRQHAAAAFSEEISGEENVIVAVEVNRDVKPDQYQEIIDAIKSNILSQCELKLHLVLLLKIGELPLTTSGKIQRQLFKKLWQEKKVKIMNNFSFPEAALAAPKLNTNRDFSYLPFLINIVKEKIHTDNIDIKLPISFYGFDSMDYVQFIHKLRENYNISIELSDIIELDTLSEINDVILLKESASCSKKNEISSNNIYPLSSLQLALYRTQKRMPQSEHYLIVKSILISRKPDYEFFTRIFEKLFSHHSVLTSEILVQQNAFYISQTRCSKDIIDIVNIKSGDSVEAHISLLTENMLQNIETNLVKVVFFILENGDINITFGINHILTDLWSMSILVNDFFSLLHNKPLEQTNSYQEYAENTSAQFFSKEKSFWTDYFQKNPMPENAISLPLCKNFTKNDFQFADIFQFTINEHICRKIKELCFLHKLSPYAILMSAYAFVLYKYSGDEKILIGSPFNNRTFGPYAKTAGLFVNTLPFIISIDTKKKIIDYIKLVNSMSVHAHINQSLPLPSIVACSNLSESSSSSGNLYDIMFTYQRIPSNSDLNLVELLMPEAVCTRKINNIEITVLPQKRVTSDVLLDLAIIQSEDRMKGYLKCPKMLFPQGVLEQITVHYTEVLNAFVDNIEKNLDDINILSKNEIEILVEKNNKMKVMVDENETLMKIFLNTVNSNPENIAISDDNSCINITYSQLNHFSSVLAQKIVNKINDN